MGKSFTSVPAGFDLAGRAVGLDYAVAPQVEEDERVQRGDGCSAECRQREAVIGQTRFESNSPLTMVVSF